jgi:hypothetical protein
LFQKSQEAAVDRIEQLVAEHRIACSFRRLDAFLFPATGVEFSDARKQQKEEYEAVRAAGGEVEHVRGVPLVGYENAPVLRYDRQAAFHPLR